MCVGSWQESRAQATAKDALLSPTALNTEEPQHIEIWRKHLEALVCPGARRNAGGFNLSVDELEFNKRILLCVCVYLG